MFYLSKFKFCLEKQICFLEDVYFCLGRGVNRFICPFWQRALFLLLLRERESFKDQNLSSLEGCSTREAHSLAF